MQASKVTMQMPTLLPFARDRKSTRLNSSHGYISYAVFRLKKHPPPARPPPPEQGQHRIPISGAGVSPVVGLRRVLQVQAPLVKRGPESFAQLLLLFDVVQA